MENVAVVSSLAREQTDTHEFIKWEDGSLTIENAMYQYDFNPLNDHACLDQHGQRKLYEFLKSIIE